MLIHWIQILFISETTNGLQLLPLTGVSESDVVMSLGYVLVYLCVLLINPTTGNA